LANHAEAEFNVMVLHWSELETIAAIFNVPQRRKIGQVFIIVQMLWMVSSI